MSSGVARPLVTFYVMTYNQARFVRQAVEAALAQTYSPLQIVLSDDCSTDGTFDIIQDAVKGYSGPHMVVLNRNDRNLGISEHVNRIIELSVGELIIAADGDDVSSPVRAERCVDVWLRNGRPAALYSGVSCIDSEGRPSKRDGNKWFAQFLPAEHESREDRLLRFAQDGSPRLVSCSAAWTKELCEAFGPLPKRVWFEDSVITLRAWLFDRIDYIPEALVSYRRHDSNIFNRVEAPLTTRKARENAERASSTVARRLRECFMSYSRDLELAERRGWITRSLCHDIKRHVERNCVLHQVIEDWWNVNWLLRLTLLMVAIRFGRLGERRWCSPRLLPFQVFLTLGAFWSRARSIGLQDLWRHSYLLSLGTLPLITHLATELM
jgi:glycosyltransferase involved in cell wall biosynthesis